MAAGQAAAKPVLGEVDEAARDRIVAKFRRYDEEQGAECGLAAADVARSIVDAYCTHTGAWDKKRECVDWIAQKYEERLAPQAERDAAAQQQQQRLQQALPALQAAAQALNSLRKADTQELKAMKHPPERVKLTMDAVNSLLGRPTGWDDGVRTLGDPHFLQTLVSFDKDRLGQRDLARIDKFVKDPDFSPEVVRATSIAAAGLCQWVHAMHNYGKIKLSLQSAPSSGRWYKFESAVLQNDGFTCMKFMVVKDADLPSLATWRAALDQVDSMHGVTRAAPPPGDAPAAGSGGAPALPRQPSGRRRVSSKEAGEVDEPARDRVADKLRGFAAAHGAEVGREGTIILKEIAEAHLSRSGVWDKKHGGVNWRAQKYNERLTPPAERGAADEQRQRRLQEAAPVLQAAAAALDSLQKNDIQDIKSYVAPPVAVQVVMEAVQELLRGPTDWKSCKKALADPGFLKKLVHFEKDSISAQDLARVAKYTSRPDFNPETVAKSSKAAAGLCQWVRTMESYAKVAREVELGPSDKWDKFYEAVLDGEGFTCSKSIVTHGPGATSLASLLAAAEAAQ